MLTEPRTAGNRWELCRECKKALLQLSLLKAGDIFFPQEEKLRYQGTFLTATQAYQQTLWTQRIWYHYTIYITVWTPAPLIFVDFQQN